MAERPFGVPPGHIPVVMLTPEQYAALNRDTQLSPYFAAYFASRLGHSIADVLKLATQTTLILRLRGEVRGQTLVHTGLAWAARHLTLDELEKQVLDTIETDFQYLMGAWNTGNAAGMGASFASAIEQFLGSSQLLYAYKDLQYQIAITPRLRRQWNRLFLPAVPNFPTAWQMWRKGLLSKEDLYTYASYDGWDKPWVDKLIGISADSPNPATAYRMLARGLIDDAAFNDFCFKSGWDKDFWDKLKGVYEWWPSAHEAFYMWKKGIISEADRNKFYKGHGYPSSLFSQLTDNFYIYPNAHEAFWMWKKGIIRADVRNMYYSAQGYPSTVHEKLTENMEQLPTAIEAFYMWKKGSITKAQRNVYYRANGYPDHLFEQITSNMEYTPTFYDLMRLADYVELDPIWMTKKLTERGMKETDIPKYIDALKYRPLREEVKSLVSQLVWRYRYGRITMVELESELDKLPIGATEKSLTIDRAELLYEDELIDEQMNIYKWRFRMGWITEEDYLNSLLDLGIREEKANLIVETEKAQGYFGYY